jgi:uncharacterized protein (UPF0261 family)
MPKKHIAIIATCDTKRAEVAFMMSLIKDRGVDPVVIDVGPRFGLILAINASPGLPAGNWKNLSAQSNATKL